MWFWFTFNFIISLEFLSLTLAKDFNLFKEQCSGRPWNQRLEHVGCQSWGKQRASPAEAQRPAHFHYTNVQILVKWLEPVHDALPCAVKNGVLIRNSVLGWGKHVTPGQHVHMDTSCPIEVLLHTCLKLKHIHTQSHKIKIKIKHIHNKTSMGQLVSMCLKCVHMLVSMHSKFSLKLRTTWSFCGVGSSCLAQAQKPI